MEKIMLSVPKEMIKFLEKERAERLLDSIPETVRAILGEYSQKKN